MKAYSIEDIADKSKRFPVVDGPFGTQLHADEYVTEGIPVIRITNLSFHGKFNEKDLVFITNEKAEDLKRSEVVKDDIIIAKTGATIGKSAKFPLEYGIIASSCLKVSLNKEIVNPDFFLYQIISYEGQRRIIDGSTGSTRTTINNGPFKKIEFDFPEKNVQDFIVKILSKADNTIAQTEALISKYQRIKTGLMQDLLTRGIDEHGNIRSEKKHRFKTVNGLRVPEEWDVVRFEEIADPRIRWSYTGGPFGSNLKSEDYTISGVRIIQLQNIGDGIFKDDYKIYTSKEKADELISCNIYPGEIILSKMGDPVARACLIPFSEERFLMASDGIRLSPDLRHYNTKFVLEYINFYTFRNEVSLVATGSTRQRIGLTELRKINFIKPSLIEQNGISKILISIDESIGLEKMKRSKLQSLKIGLMKDLLSGKVSVKIREEILE